MIWAIWNRQASGWGNSEPSRPQIGSEQGDGRRDGAGSTGRSRGVQEEPAGDLLGSEENHSIEHLHGIDGDEVKDSPHLFPEVSLTAGLLPGRSKQRTGHLLDLVRQEGEEHEHHKDHAQVLLAQSIVVLEMVSLVLEVSFSAWRGLRA